MWFLHSVTLTHLMLRLLMYLLSSPPTFLMYLLFIELNSRKMGLRTYILQDSNNVCHLSSYSVISNCKSTHKHFDFLHRDIIASRYAGNEDDRYQAIRNMTDLLRGTFSSHFVFPVLGHSDPAPSEKLTSLWMNWLPLEALQTFEKGNCGKFWRIICLVRLGEY